MWWQYALVVGGYFIVRRVVFAIFNIEVPRGAGKYVYDFPAATMGFLCGYISWGL